ncbi:hypothetical protein CEXT_43231 [Caerostris extrusa]|uniref:Uncharacterized protein n=1 Tax=Caerostris extrusa TaxID=172846 RepID=A0AAV4N8X5_CAEEX|nr:hypothetical protein CEXT_43231 [Caerostris extrusa]
MPNADGEKCDDSMSGSKFVGEEFMTYDTIVKDSANNDSVEDQPAFNILITDSEAIAFFCAAFVSACAYAPLVNTGVSAVSNHQDAYGNYAYRYDIKDAATGSLNSKDEVGKVGSIDVAAPVVYGAYAAPAVVAYVAPAVAAYAAPSCSCLCCPSCSCLCCPSCSCLCCPSCSCLLLQLCSSCSFLCPSYRLRRYCRTSRYWSCGLRRYCRTSPSAAPVLAGRGAYGGIGAPTIAAPLAYGGTLGHGGALGLGYGAGILGAGLGKAAL